MTEYAGNIRKMRTTLDSPVTYRLPIGEHEVEMNPLIGQQISLQFAGDIHCIACGRQTKKSFNQGYCYPCMRSLAECDVCIVRPEQCHFDHGTCRDEAWANEHCMQDHIVYLANSSGAKVGITRHTQVPTRWIDQGASQALPMFRAKNRLVSGLLEVAIKQWVSDRTDWRKMLKGAPEKLDLQALANELIIKGQVQIDTLKSQYGDQSIIPLREAGVEIDYPVSDYPAKVSSFNFDKTPNIVGRLMGIKGQYLILDSGVLNIRKFAGYQLVLQTTIL